MRKKILLVRDLYHRAFYELSRGINWRAITAAAAGVGAAFAGLLAPKLRGLSNYAGFAVSFVWYRVAMRTRR